MGLCGFCGVNLLLDPIVAVKNFGKMREILVWKIRAAMAELSGFITNAPAICPAPADDVPSTQSFESIEQGKMQRSSIDNFNIFTLKGHNLEKDREALKAAILPAIMEERRKIADFGKDHFAGGDFWEKSFLARSATPSDRGIIALRKRLREEAIAAAAAVAAAKSVGVDAGVSATSPSVSEACDDHRAQGRDIGNGGSKGAPRNMQGNTRRVEKNAQEDWEEVIL